MTLKSLMGEQVNIYEDDLRFFKKLLKPKASPKPSPKKSMKKESSYDLSSRSPRNKSSLISMSSISTNVQSMSISSIVSRPKEVVHRRSITPNKNIKPPLKSRSPALKSKEIEQFPKPPRRTPPIGPPQNTLNRVARRQSSKSPIPETLSPNQPVEINQPSPTPLKPSAALLNNLPQPVSQTSQPVHHQHAQHPAHPSPLPPSSPALPLLPDHPHISIMNLWSNHPTINHDLINDTHNWSSIEKQRVELERIMKELAIEGAPAAGQSGGEETVQPQQLPTQQPAQVRPLAAPVPIQPVQLQVIAPRPKKPLVQQLSLTAPVDNPVTPVSPFTLPSVLSTITEESSLRQIITQQGGQQIRRMPYSSNHSSHDKGDPLDSSISKISSNVFTEKENTSPFGGIVIGNSIGSTSGGAGSSIGVQQTSMHRVQSFNRNLRLR